MNDDQLDEAADSGTSEMPPLIDYIDQITGNNSGVGMASDIELLEDQWWRKAGYE